MSRGYQRSYYRTIENEIHDKFDFYSHLIEQIQKVSNYIVKNNMKHFQSSIFIFMLVNLHIYCSCLLMKNLVVTLPKCVRRF